MGFLEAANKKDVGWGTVESRWNKYEIDKGAGTRRLDDSFIQY